MKVIWLMAKIKVATKNWMMIKLTINNFLKKWKSITRVITNKVFLKEFKSIINILNLHKTQKNRIRFTINLLKLFQIDSRNSNKILIFTKEWLTTVRSNPINIILGMIQQNIMITYKKRLRRRKI